MISTLRSCAKKSISYAQRSMSVKSLKEVLAAQIPAKQEALKSLKKEYGHLSLGEVSVDQCIGGGRDVACMYYETSLLDAQEVSFFKYIFYQFYSKTDFHPGYQISRI